MAWGNVNARAVRESGTQVREGRRSWVKSSFLGSRGVVILELEQAAFRLSLFEQGELESCPGS
jgi:hypothetical protein